MKTWTEKRFLTCFSLNSSEILPLIWGGFSDFSLCLAAALKLRFTFKSDGAGWPAQAIGNGMKRAWKEGRLTYVVATGGFKPESTFAVTAAYLAGAHGAVYIHETFKEVVELPMLPLQLRQVLVRFARGEADEHDVARHLGMDIHHLERIKLMKKTAEGYTLHDLLLALLKLQDQ